ncbi:AroM family protein [Antarctobacter sp.]|uniref:AroM family protein n=1 Tax=Antarctobacter sp. TaxID=1872577 RepID=UPI003A9155A1
MPDTLRIAFVTIGTSPRADIVPEMVEDILNGRPASALSVEEFGVLDGLSEAELDVMLAKGDEPRFATSAEDGREVAVSIGRTEERLNALLCRIDGMGFDLIVLLCTGTKITPLTHTMVIEAQKVVDHAIEAVTLPAGRLGILLPLEAQIEGFAARHPFAVDATIAAGSPYDGAALAPRVVDLADCPIIVMHCMGYTGAMRDALRANLPGHVLHARGLVSAHVRQFL